MYSLLYGRLACELVSAVFLNIPGYSPALQHSLDHYLSASLHNPSFNAAQKDRKQISNCIQVNVVSVLIYLQFIN